MVSTQSFGLPAERQLRHSMQATSIRNAVYLAATWPSSKGLMQEGPPTKRRRSVTQRWAARCERRAVCHPAAGFSDRVKSFPQRHGRACGRAKVHGYLHAHTQRVMHEAFKRQAAVAVHAYVPKRAKQCACDPARGTDDRSSNSREARSARSLWQLLVLSGAWRAPQECGALAVMMSLSSRPSAHKSPTSAPAEAGAAPGAQALIEWSIGHRRARLTAWAQT